MRRFWQRLFIIGALVGFAQFASAERLGVPHPEAAPGEGFTLESGDVANSLNIGMLTQLRAAVSSFDDNDGISSNDSDPDTAFAVDRLRLKIRGTFWNRDLRFVFHPEYRGGEAGGTFVVSDAYLDFSTRRKQFAVRIGQFKVPFLRESSAVLADESFFINPSLQMQKSVALLDRDTGVMMHGLVELATPYQIFGYSFGIFDGRGMNQSLSLGKGDFATGSPFAGAKISEGDLMAAGRIFFYLGRSRAMRIKGEGYIYKDTAVNGEDLELEFGISHSSVHGTEGDTTNLRAPDTWTANQDPFNPQAPHSPSDRASAIDITARAFNGLEAQLEYVFLGEVDDGNLATPDRSYHGVKAQVTYNFGEKYGAFGFSVSNFDPDANSDNDEFREYRIGWNRYFQGNANKLSVNFTETLHDIDSGTSVRTEKEYEFLMQWQVIL